MPRDYKIPLPDVLAAHRSHRAGWSIRALARMHWTRWGYASPESANEGLRHAFRTLSLDVRDQAAATMLARTVHGHNRRGMADPAHPDHAAYLEHRRWTAAQRRTGA
jgi:hypothetical protein